MRAAGGLTDGPPVRAAVSSFAHICCHPACPFWESGLTASTPEGRALVEA